MFHIWLVSCHQVEELVFVWKVKLPLKRCQPFSLTHNRGRCSPRSTVARGARRASGAGAPGKFWDHALYMVENVLFDGLLWKRWGIRIVRECCEIEASNPEGKREMYESSRVLENPFRYGMGWLFHPRWNSFEVSQTCSFLRVGQRKFHCFVRGG